MSTADAVDPKVAGALAAIETLAASVGLSLEDAVAAARTGAIGRSRTVADALDRAMNQATAGTRGALGPYVKVLRHGMPGACTCTCNGCLEVLERHRAVPGGDGGREPVSCPCTESGRCACPTSAHLIGTTCLQACPVLGPVAVAALDDEADTVRNWVRARARAQRRQLRRNARRAAHGRAQRRTQGEHAVEQFNDALRRMYAHGGLRLETRLERIEAIPATRRPRRTEGRGLTPGQFQEVARVAWTGGGDPDLDGLLVVFEVCTGARREGILELRTDSLDVAGATVCLWEKAGDVRWQPAQRELLAMLVEHVIDRHLAVVDPRTWADATADDVLAGRARLPSGVPVFHYRPALRDGTLVPRPATRRRFNTLYGRIQRELPWADQHGVHGHDLRRTGSELDRAPLRPRRRQGLAPPRRRRHRRLHPGHPRGGPGRLRVAGLDRLRHRRLSGPARQPTARRAAPGTVNVDHRHARGGRRCSRTPTRRSRSRRLDPAWRKTTSL